MTIEDPKELVRRGYNALSDRYDQAFGGEKYRTWLTELDKHISPAASVLDLGCGSGIPVAQAMAATGRRVVGVDISDVQIARARELVPKAEFLLADATTIDFEPETFDAVVCFYALIHMPQEEQVVLLTKVAEWLPPGGWFVATTGHNAWTGIESNWLGGDEPMWWSHPDAATYRVWLEQAGLTVQREEFVPEGSGGHALFWTTRQAERILPANLRVRPRNVSVRRSNS